VRPAITARLAEFVAATRWEDLPGEVVQEAKRSLVNFFATALGGCRDGAVEKASRVLGRYAGEPTATVIGRGERTDPLDAACLNAMSANVFDFDDTHIPTIIHPTAPVAPAVLAWAESSRLSGREALLAFVLGVEVECRLGNALHPWHYHRGWHITSTCGIFGAAASIGKAAGLDAERIGWALGNASAQSSGLVETLGTMAKSIGVGHSARNGLLSALLAREGFSGPAEPLAGERAFLRVMGEDPRFEAITGKLGERWEILANTYKPYPCGVVLNPVIEACLELANDRRIPATEIDHVEIVGHPLLRERTDRLPPANGRESQVSAQHGVAAALARGRAGLAEFSDSGVADPALRAFAGKVRFFDDAGFALESARVTVVLRDGEALSAFVEKARGSLARPLTDADLERKLTDLASYGGSGCDPRPLAAAVWSLDRLDDAALLMPLAAGRRTGGGGC
jgi:2-methylcitrate dehydratase PrpD